MTFCMNTSEFRNYIPQRPVEVVMGMLSFFSFFGSIGNSLVLYVYTRKRNKLASTVFIISLAGADFITCILVMPYTVIVEFINYEIYYDVLCKLYMFLITCNVPFSVFVMVAIALDRYVCICHPHCHTLDSRRAKSIILGLALLVVVIGMITALAHGVYQYGFKPATSDVADMVNFTEDGLQSVVANCSFEESNCTSVVHTVLVQANCTVPVMERAIEYSGICASNQLIFSTTFRKTFQKVYAFMFLMCLVLVAILYTLIYKSVLERRARRLKQRRATRICLYRETSLTEAQDTCTVPTATSRFTTTDISEPQKAMLDKEVSLKEKYWLANIRTAAMLFVVTLVFIIAFLPSWLMAHNLIPFNMIVFYMYFAYNVANPIVYAFMNPTFRREMRDVLSCRKCSNQAF